MPSNEEEEFTFRNLFNQRKKDLAYLWIHRVRIGLIALLGAAIGALAAWYKAPTYTARLSFVVEESKAGGGGLISSLAGQLGFDFGSISSGTGGVLAGDNVLQLLVSQNIIKQALTSPFTESSKYTLADRYADSYKLKAKWKQNSRIGQQINFPTDTKHYTRLQDSLLQVIMKKISEDELSVSKPDKKLSFFALTTTLKDEQLSALLCTRLIDVASQFYIQTKTKRLRSNVERLQHRADSIGYILNKKTYSASAANSIMLDANPAYTTTGVSAELQERDKRVLQTIYAEIIKNLEVSRTMLMQETPTFQVVDTPDLPLKKNRLKYPAGIAIGFLAAGAFYSLFLLLFRKQSN